MPAEKGKISVQSSYSLSHSRSLPSQQLKPRGSSEETRHSVARGSVLFPQQTRASPEEISNSTLAARYQTPAGLPGPVPKYPIPFQVRNPPKMDAPVPVTEGQPATDPFHVSQLHVILNRIDKLLTDFANGLQSGEFNPEQDK